MRPLPKRGAERAAANPHPKARLRAALAWTATIAYMALLFWLSSRPGDVVGRWNFLRVPDYVLHGAAYLVLGALAHLAFATSFRWPSWLRACAAIVLASLYGVTDEVHQVFVPGRVASWQDVLADAAGAAVGQVPFLARPVADRIGENCERIPD